jgi:hypothetical protein
MEAGTVQFKNPLNFLLNKILICYCRSQIFELYRISKDALAVFALYSGQETATHT